MRRTIRTEQLEKLIATRNSTYDRCAVTLVNDSERTLKPAHEKVFPKNISHHPQRLRKSDLALDSWAGLRLSDSTEEN
jgi:hypothetical protein